MVERSSQTALKRRKFSANMFVPQVIVVSHCLSARLRDFLSWSLSIIRTVSYLKNNPFEHNKTAPRVIFTQGFATYGFLTETHQYVILVPSLQSHWLMMHISMMVLGYAPLLCGSLLSIALIVITFRKIIRAFAGAGWAPPSHHFFPFFFF
jgi:hypothetical protein